MSLLKKYADAIAVKGNREVHYGRLISFAPSKPVTMNGDIKDKLNMIIEFDGVKTKWYVLKDAVYGLPNYVGPDGVMCAATIQESEPDETGKTFANMVSLGIQAI